MKQWVKKLFLQFDIDPQKDPGGVSGDLSDDKSTLLFILDVYNKHLIEIENHPVRKVRSALDELTKSLLSVSNGPKSEDILFQIRQFFSSYRIDETTYIQNTFDDFKKIIWEFADQLSDEIRQEEKMEIQLKSSLNELKDAVESDSIDVLRLKSKNFIQNYSQAQHDKDERKQKRINSVKKSLSTVRKKLTEANLSMRQDHLTKAYNRKSFDEDVRRFYQMNVLDKVPVTLISFDIDFFKKINDNYGHDVGDFILKECVILLKKIFNREKDVLARLGGEEFIVILPDFTVEHAIKKCEEVLSLVRKEVFVHGTNQIKFTISMGVAQLVANESLETWLKRVDMALYHSKNSGRDKYSIAPDKLLEKVA